MQRFIKVARKQQVAIIRNPNSLIQDRLRCRGIHSGEDEKLRGSLARWPGAGIAARHPCRPQLVYQSQCNQSPGKAGPRWRRALPQSPPHTVQTDGPLPLHDPLDPPLAYKMNAMRCLASGHTLVRGIQHRRGRSTHVCRVYLWHNTNDWCPSSFPASHSLARDPQTNHLPPTYASWKVLC